MEYYLNEYSVRGQFRNTDDFFASLRGNTIPVLEKVMRESDSVIIKKDTFWQLEICKGIPLNRIPSKKNERSGELFALKRRLLNVILSEPYWSADELCETEEVEYQFDVGYKDQFEKHNCFTKAIVSEGAIISFEHAEYKSDILKVIVKKDGEEHGCELDNISNTAWWDKARKIKTWRIDNKFHIEVRAKEFDYHPPHFHVECADYKAVYRLPDGKLYKSGNKKLPPVLEKEIKDLYTDMKDELIGAWELLHNKIQ